MSVRGSRPAPGASPVITASTASRGPVTPGTSASIRATNRPSSSAAAGGMAETERFQGAVRIAMPMSPASS